MAAATPPRTGRTPRRPPPEDVTDPLLWTDAAKVAAAHQPGPDGTCSNLQCRGQRAPCPAARAAHRATQLARDTTSLAPPRHPPRGRATVPAGPSGFAELSPDAATRQLRPTPQSPFAAFRRPHVRAADYDNPEDR